MLTQERLKELLDYNPETGVFTWKETRGRVAKGYTAGWKSEEGYVRIKIDGILYRAHQLAFLYMSGDFTIGQCDHINHVRDDNRWNNLRDVTQSGNQRNMSMPKRNKSGIIGVCWHKRDKKWRATIWIDNKLIILGSYETIFDAAAERIKANRKYDYHCNHGK